MVSLLIKIDRERSGSHIEFGGMPKVVDLDEASERFGVSVVTLRRAIRDGKLKRYRVWGSRKVFIDPEELERLREPRVDDDE